MRVCPKCGYKDHLEWKNLPHQLYHEYMTIEDFQRLYPKLAEELLRIAAAKQKGNVLDGKDGHAYHLTRLTDRGKFVHRCLIELCPKGKWFSGSSIYENPKRAKNQRRLVDCINEPETTQEKSDKP